jgi:hypothetical protein
MEMKSQTLLMLLIAGSCTVLLTCSSIPRSMSKEDDIEGREAAYGGADQSLLIASRTSEFKDAVVGGIEQAFKGQSMSITVIGLKDLRDESAEDYDAVVLVNTCIAWSLDPQVDTFLHKYRGTGNIVVFTTSGDGHWEPKKQNREFDTVASASEMARVDEVTAEIVGKVRALLGS